MKFFFTRLGFLSTILSNQLSIFLHVAAFRLLPMAASALIMGSEVAVVALSKPPSSNLEVSVGVAVEVAVEVLQIGNLKTANPFWKGH